MCCSEIPRQHEHPQATCYADGPLPPRKQERQPSLRYGASRVNRGPEHERQTKGGHTPPPSRSKKTATAPTPTEQTYGPLQVGYSHFNRELFGNQLPSLLMTLQRKANTQGYYSPKKFVARSGDDRTDELALNPAHFGVHIQIEIYSTLVHEMAHHWQEYFGKPPRKGYHNKEWAEVMMLYF
jgi:hypothetical protein